MSPDPSRLRLMPRDPGTLFAFWELSADDLEALRQELGERTLAVSAVTLRVFDPESGACHWLLKGSSARSSYLPAHPDWAAHQVELGLTLPSGEFRPLATSNVVEPPRLGPSAEPAGQTLSFGPERQKLDVAPQRRAVHRGSGTGTRPGLGTAHRGGASDALRPGGGRS